MKYLEHLGLENVSKTINSTEFSGGISLHGRVEIYSTKKGGEDKKHSKLLESKLASASDQSPTTLASSTVFQLPCAPDLADSPSGDKGSDAKKTRKMLVDLIQTLNAAQLDHDFSELSHDSFVMMPLQEAVMHINTYLGEVNVKQQTTFTTTLWREIDNALSGTLNHCEVYRLTDDSYAEDLDEGITSSFHFFFCNKELKRLCYFNCHTTCKYRKYSNGNFEEESGDDMDIENSSKASQDEEEAEEDDEDGWN